MSKIKQLVPEWYEDEDLIALEEQAERDFESGEWHKQIPYGDNPLAYLWYTRVIQKLWRKQNGF